MMTLKDLRGLAIDMDGVLYRGNTPIPGAAEFLDWLTERSFPFLLLTNNSTLDPAAYERKLAGMGIHVGSRQIMTSSVVTADYLARNFAPGARVYIVGEYGLETCIAERGFTITEEDPQVVAVGMDRQLTYAKLRTAALAIRKGATFVASNGDRTLPTEIGEIPGAGSIVAALVAATGQQPVMIGKPEPPMLEMALARLNTPRRQTAMVGDRLETDVVGGKRVGMATALVLSGVTRQAPPPGSEDEPDFVFADLGDMLAAWQRE